MLCNYHNVCAVICGRTRFSPTDYTQHPLHQNIFIKHKILSSVRQMSFPTVCFVLLISNYLHERGTAARYYRVGKTIAMLRSGNITVYISNCLHELGTAARRHAVQQQVACEKSRSAL